MYSLVRPFFLLGCMLFLCSCSVTKSVRKKNTEVVVQSKKKEAKKIVSNVAAEKTLPKRPLSTNEKVVQYLTIFGPIAQREMREYKIPASITLAQGLLESGFGEGRLAIEANNHFGIKCHRGWQRGRIYHDDDEKGECFRVYADAGESYRDHSLFSHRARPLCLFISPWEKRLQGMGKRLEESRLCYRSKIPRQANSSH